MASIVENINNFSYATTEAQLLAFAIEREKIRQRKEAGEAFPWTKDKVLQKGKFLNVFREDDRVSRCIEKHAKPISHDLTELIPMLYIARLVNREDRLDELFKSGSKWARSQATLKAKMTEYISNYPTRESGPVCNPGAYQINPRLGFDQGYRNIRDSMINKIPKQMPSVCRALLSSNDMAEASAAANTAFGGFANFWLFQVAIDIAWLRPDIMSRDSNVYFGSGSANHTVDPVTLQTYINTHKPTTWRKLYLFDIENLLCEHRKYAMRKANGIPAGRKYKAS